MIKKEADKVLKYKDLIIEIQHMCNMKVKVIPVMTGATGTISKSLRQYWSNIPGKHKIIKSSHTGHCTHTLESTNVKVKYAFLMRQTLHVAQIVNTEQLQHYKP